MNLSIAGRPTERLEYMAGDIALCRRHVVGLVESPDQMKKPRFELSDLHLNEAAGEANREIELHSIPKLKDPRIRALMTAVNIERTSGFPSGQLFLQSIEMALAAVLVRTYSLSVKAWRPIKGGLSDVGRRNVIDLVRSRISEDISLADMAAVTGLSVTHFSHIFKKSMGESPHQFVLQQRVQCAKELLVSLNLRMIDIALAFGFKTQQHFARIFRKVCGLSPTEYQRLKLSRRLRDSYVRSSASSTC
ncbi:helix-turn-helix domain-containing protein [Tunturiibacter gelidoferens]|uniref:AraC family transcriptional regulator n=1 Tax=Tunturiibacter gelidiferens TaxID=3069689 RepID=A0A9X0U6F3_9BACT|nr:AraC family transcriptional regulator [Edaphobacter lichenicola]MBB5331506.1 AraC family transcriptional regulator [Edaphobacter lichenicola]